MPYTLYGEIGSGSCSVECALAEIGAEVRLVEIDLGAMAQRGESYLAVNPVGKVPCLELPEGDRVTESAAILITLAERHPEASLLPPVATSDRAEALRWLVYLVSEIYPLIEISDYPTRFAAEGAPAEALRDRVRELLRTRWQLVEAAITGRPWLLPAGFSVTDLHIATMSRWSLDKAWRGHALPRVEAIAAAIAERPAAGPVWRRHFTQRDAA